MAKNVIIGIVASLAIAVMLAIVISDQLVRKPVQPPPQPPPENGDTGSPGGTATHVDPQPSSNYPIHHIPIAGDTLIQLAKRYYGDRTLHKIIAAANNMANPDQLAVGRPLIIPDPARRQELLAQYEQLKHGTRYAVYRTQPGDTLANLARRYCAKPGNPEERVEYRERISKENALSQGPDEPLPAGRWLRLPRTNALERAKGAPIFWAWNHAVASGDSFYSLSGASDDGERLLREINGIDPSVTAPPQGGKILLPDWSTVPVAILRGATD